MYSYRVWQPGDLAWMEGAAGAAAWEALSAEDRAMSNPAEVLELAKAKLHGAVSTPWGTAFVAQYNGEPIGMMIAAVGPDTSTEELQGFLMEAWVAPDHRARGVGGRLQDIAEEWFRRMGLRRAKMWTTVDNEPVLRMAVRRGYRPGGLIGMKSL